MGMESWITIEEEYLQFILEQLSDLEDINYRAMMGEYIIYASYDLRIADSSAKSFQNKSRQTVLSEIVN